MEKEEGLPLKEFPCFGLNSNKKFEREIANRVARSIISHPNLGFDMSHFLFTENHVFTVNEGTPEQETTTAKISTYFLKAKTVQEIQKELGIKKIQEVKPAYRDYWSDIIRMCNDPRVLIKYITFTTPRAVYDNELKKLDLSKVKFCYEFDEHVCQINDTPKNIFETVQTQGLDGKWYSYLRMRLPKKAMIAILTSMYGPKYGKRVYRKKRRIAPENNQFLDISYNAICRMEIEYMRV